MKKKKIIQLNIGCGVSLADNFINIDNFFTLKDLKTKKGKYQNARIPKNAQFVKADMSSLPFENNYADYIECVDAIEHVGFFEIEKTLKEFYRVLKPNCKLGILTTNFDELARLWTEYVTGKLFKNQEEINKYFALAQIIYGNQIGPGEYHKIPFNPPLITYLLNQAGFDLNKILITIYPTNCSKMPPCTTYLHLAKKSKTPSIISEMMWIEAIK